MKTIESVTRVQGTIARAADMIGAVPEPIRPTSVQDYLRKISLNAPRDVKDSIGTLAGAGVGYYMWKRHHWLGAIGGASLGRNLPALVTGVDRNIGVANMAQTGAAIATSRYFHKYPKTGFVVGWLVGGLVTGGFR